MADMSTQAAARFRDTQLIGRGGFGDVYSALDEVLQRNVAVKIFRELDPRQHQRIFDALRRSSELRHPNIVQVYDTISQDDALHVVLTLCENGSLADLVQKSRLDQQDVCRLFSGLADGVSYMHAHGIAHCDLKLANVLLDDSQQPVLIDLDNCRDLTDSTSWEFQGTPSYMAPELINQACAPSIQSEVYAMGIMLYEMLQGELLADSWPIHEAINRTGFAVSAFDHSQFASGRDWRAILEKATHEEPGRRYASIAEMAADVASVAEGKAISARPIGRLERMTRTAKQQPLTSALILVTFLSVSIGVAAANVARYQAAGNQRRLERNNANLTEKIDELRQSELRLQEVISEVKNELVVAERAESNQRRLTAEAEAATAKLQEAAERSIELTEQAQAALNQARESEASVKQLEERRSALGELLNTTAFESESMEYFAAIQKTQQLIQQEDWQAASLSLGSTNSEFRGIEFDILSASIRSKQVHPKKIELCEVSPRIWKRRVLASRPGFGKTQPFGKGASFRAFVPAKRTYGSARRIVQSYAELQSSLVDNPSLIFDDKFFGRSYSVEKLRYKPMLMLDDGSLVVYESSSSHGGFASVLTFRDEHYERLFEGKSKIERLELIEGLVGVERQTEGGDPDQIVNQPQATQDRLAGNGDAVEKPVKRDSMDARTDSDPATQPTENPAQSFLQWVLNTGGDVKQSNGSQLAVEDVPESPLNIREIVLRNVTEPDQHFRGSPPNLRISRIVLENCPIRQVANILLVNKESLNHIELKGKVHSLAIKQLVKMQQLRELRFTTCSGISTQAWRDMRLPQSIRYISLNSTKAESFEFLQQIPSFYSVTLRACGISDQGLVHLRKFPRLKRIRLGANPITDQGLQHMASLQQLDALSLDDTNVGDVGMNVVGKLKELTELSVKRTQVSDVGLKSLAQLTKLERLELTATDVTADGINALEFPRLKRLNIEKCNIDRTAIREFRDRHPSCTVLVDSNVPHVNKLARNTDTDEEAIGVDSIHSAPATQPNENPTQSFVQWVLNTGGDVKQSNGNQLAVEDVSESPLNIQEIVLRNVTDPDQQFRGSPPNLGIERVVLENCPLPQVSKILLPNKESLTHIEMKGKIDRLAIDQLAEMPQLKELRLTACWGIPPQAWRELRLPQNIRYVSLNATKAEEFRFLQQIPNVEGLTLWACGISDQDLVHLRNLPKLKRIQLGSNQEVTDRGMSHVASVEQLAFLSVYDTAVGDIGMKEIGRLKELTKLSLGRTQVSDVGLKSLGHLTKLEWLELTATEVTADGINALEFPRLERLHIEECDIDATAIGRFLDTHPSCKVTPST